MCIQKRSKTVQIRLPQRPALGHKARWALAEASLVHTHPERLWHTTVAPPQVARRAGNLSRHTAAKQLG